MADEQTAEQVAADQRATDPRLEQSLEAAAPAVVEAAQTEEPGEGAEAPAEPPVEAAPKPKKSAEEVLKGRLGHMTKTLSAKDAALAEANAQLAAAQALLAAAGRQGSPGTEMGADGAPAPAAAPIAAPGARTYTQAEFDAQVAAKAAADEFNRAADTMYDAGAQKFTDWKDAVETLNASGLMNRELLDAAMATPDGAAVIHHLGTDLEEAERIAALPPIRKAAELTKLAISLSTPRSVPISGMPAPIKPLNGAAAPTVDLHKAAEEGGNSMGAYAAARAKQGARWAQPKGQRTG